MSGINVGVLQNAYPLSTEHIKELESQVLNNNETFVYLDENSELCFAMPYGINDIKELAWHNAYELSKENDIFVKKAYKKNGLKSFYLDKVLQKQNINDTWPDPDTPAERLEGDGAEYYTLAPTALSFRSTAPLNELQEIQINGVTVDPSNYTLEEGSTIVTFPIEYLKTLNVGSYEVAVASDSKTVKGGFNVKAPELNEHGFYYNQPYTAYVEAFGGNTVVFIRNDGTLDLIVTNTGYVETCNYTIVGNQLNITAVMGTFTASFADNGNSAFVNELYTTFVLGDEHITADDDYIYIYKEDIGGYEVSAIDKTKAEYGAIKTGINGIPTVKLAGYMFVDTISSENHCPITNIIIPDDVITIGENAFERCDLLENVIFGENSKLERVEDNAFNMCESLTLVTLPNSITYLGQVTFFGCTSIVNLVLPNELLALGSGMCLSCKNLSSVTIPSGIMTIYDSVFAGCTSLMNITFEGTVSQWNSIPKGSDWNYDVPATYVQCSDGQVAL